MLSPNLNARFCDLWWPCLVNQSKWRSRTWRWSPKKTSTKKFWKNHSKTAPLQGPPKAPTHALHKPQMYQHSPSMALETGHPKRSTKKVCWILFPFQEGASTWKGSKSLFKIFTVPSQARKRGNPPRGPGISELPPRLSLFFQLIIKKERQGTLRPRNEVRMFPLFLGLLLSLDMRCPKTLGNLEVLF